MGSVALRTVVHPQRNTFEHGTLLRTKPGDRCHEKLLLAVRTRPEGVPFTLQYRCRHVATYHRGEREVTLHGVTLNTIEECNVGGRIGRTTDVDWPNAISLHRLRRGKR
jgi:hypothetical protein